MLLRTNESITIYHVDSEAFKFRNLQIDFNQISTCVTRVNIK